MTVEERLTALFQDVFGDEDLIATDELTAADVEAWDSVAHINLMFAIEQEFAVQFEGNQLAEFENVGALKAWLADRAG